MPRVFVPPEELEGERVTLEGEPHRYLTRVLRLGPGEELLVFDGQGGEIEARVLEIGPRATTLGLGARRTAPPPPAIVTLLQAVPRGERMDFLVQKVTELGVSEVRPVVSARSVMEPRSENRLRRWRTIAQEAARQCGRADVPTIASPVSLDEALAAVPGDADAAKLLLWEGSRGGRPLRTALRGTERNIWVLVGPEGGFTEDEVARAEHAGFLAVGLGPRILRAETAGVVAIALCQAAVGALD